MDTETLDKQGKRLLGKDIFLGTFPAHGFPKTIKKYPAAFICNTQQKCHNGKHWIAVFIKQDRGGIFFDSFGREPKRLHSCWTKLMNTHTQRWTYNKKKVQHTDSDLCGEHCLYFLNHMNTRPWHGYAYSDDIVSKWARHNAIK